MQASLSKKASPQQKGGRGASSTFLKATSVQGEVVRSSTFLNASLVQREVAQRSCDGGIVSLYC